MHTQRGSKGPLHATAALLCLLQLAAHSAAALYVTGAGPVLVLKPDIFKRVTQSLGPVMVQFYAQNGHCRELVEPWAEAAEELLGVVPFASFDCSEEAHMDLFREHRVHRFPTILLFKPDGSLPQSLHIPRSHPMRSRALRDTALGLLTEEHVKHFQNREDAITWLEAPGTKVVFVSLQAPVVPWAKALSQRFATHLRFAQVIKAPVSDALLSHYNITAAPALAALTADDHKVDYTGPLEAPLIHVWLQQLIASDHSSKVTNSGSGVAEAAAQLEHGSGSGVQADEL